MFKSLVLGILLVHSTFCDDEILLEKSTETEKLPPHLLRSPYILANKVEIQGNSANNSSASQCPNTAILLQILDILTTSLTPLGNTQLEPEKIKYVLEVIKKYLEHSTPSTEHVELYNKFRNLEDLSNLVKKPALRRLQNPLANILPNEDLKAKVTVQIELPIGTSNCQNIHNYLVKLINSAYNQIAKYCVTTGLCNSYSTKWNAISNVDNLPYDNNPNAQKPHASDLYKLLLYPNLANPSSQNLNKEVNLPNDAYDDINSKNNVNFIDNNDIMSILQNYRPQETTSDNSNVQNNQVTKTLLEQLLSNQSPGQIYVTRPNVQENRVINNLPGYGDIANNNNLQNNEIDQSLLEKLFLIQTPGKNVISFPENQQNQDLTPQSVSGVYADTSSNIQKDQIQKLLLEKLLLNLTPGQVYNSYPNEQLNQANTSPSSNSNANNLLQNNPTLAQLLEKLLSNQTPGQSDATYLNTQQVQALNKPTDSSNNLPNNILDINKYQEYHIPDSYLQGPTQLNITYTISNGRVIPVQNNPNNIYNSTSSALVGILPANNNYALEKLLYATMQQDNRSPNANQSPSLYPNTPTNYAQSPDLLNNQPLGPQYSNAINLQSNTNSAKSPLNPFKNIQNLQHPSIGYLPYNYNINTKQDIKNPNQQNVFNQYQNSHSEIIGLNQAPRPGFTPNVPSYVNNAYANPYVLGSSLTDNNVHGNNGLNLADSPRLSSGANVVKLNSASDNNNKLVEITYVLQRPQEVLYEPVYYIKYTIPYYKFKNNLQNLLLAKPYLQNNPNLLYQELIARTNLTDSSNMQAVDRTKVIKLVGTNGTLINAKLLHANETALGEQLKIVQELNSKLDPKDVVNLNIAAVNQLKHLLLPQVNNPVRIDNAVKNHTETERIANLTLANLTSPTGNSQPLNQENISSYTSQLYNTNQPLLNNPAVYSGQQTIRYKLPVINQVLPTMPLVYSKNPFIYKQNLVYGK